MRDDKSFDSWAIWRCWLFIADDRSCCNNKVTELGSATRMCAANDILYLVNSLTDWNTYTTVNTFFTYNIKTGQMNNASFLKDAPAELTSSTLYMLEVNENNGDIYISTSEFTTNGTIYRFKKDGTFIEKFDAGALIPILLYSLIKNEKSYIYCSYV